MYSASYLWAKILLQLGNVFPEETIDEHLSTVQVIGVSDDTLIVYTNSEQVRQFLCVDSAPHICEILQEHLQCKAQLVVWGDKELKEHKNSQKKTPYNIKPQFSFSNYAVSATNEMATRIAKEIAQNPGNENYNPFFIYGPRGVGKTHLLHAIANEVIQNYPEKKVIYTLSDQFTGELIWSIQRGSLEELIQRFQSADVLLIDDIQFIAGKHSTQEAIYKIFDHLFETRKQIVVSANTPITEIGNIEDYLKARLEQSIAVRIESPDLFIRRTIIIYTSKKLKLPLTNEVVELLATHYSHSISEIISALKKLRTGVELQHLSLTKSNVKDFLGIDSH